MWLPTTKTALINEIYYLFQGTYTRYEIERVYNEVYFKVPTRWKYYSDKAACKRLQAWLIQIRKDIKEMDGDIKKLKYNFSLQESEQKKE